MAPTVLRMTTGHNLGHHHRCTNGPGQSVDVRVAFFGENAQCWAGVKRRIIMPACPALVVLQKWR